MAADAEFSLIESILWTRSSGYVLLPYHLRRIAASAACLGFPSDSAEIVRTLKGCADNLSAESFWKVRLMKAPDGTLSVSATPIEPPGYKEPIPRAVISTIAVSSADPIIRHKTTRRALYDAELKAWSARTGCFDVIFVNERAEVTEGARTNVFIQRGAAILTPPLACGLLDGTLRRWMLDSQAMPTRECVLTVADLASADRIFLGNSVRGLIEVRL
ncbi:aminotransferase class IV [Candidatus Binatus soli]|jgi:branched-subunit amino acid aminotransferase/4-amino-4-deoxychorismate lyase|uniref:aminotransferase class IV n=1 Tax=Candidatus Binatus soli TaxID=1953413 RepID=UPI003D111D46